MKHRSTLQDVQRRLVFVRVGWCEYYTGTAGDEPLRGGSFNKTEVGSEFNNFRIIRDNVYGYGATRPGAFRVLGLDDDDMSDVAIALFATRPGGSGQVLVGWYRHARVRHAFKDRPASVEGVYLWRCPVRDAVLLPTSARSLVIPKRKGGTGQAQVAYARDESGKLKRDSWIEEARAFISAYTGPSVIGVHGKAATDAIVSNDAERLLRGQGIVESAALRFAIDRHAMQVAEKRLNKQYNSVENVSAFSSFDFSCRHGRIQRKVEVKGTRTAGDSLLFSNAEVQLARNERVDLYLVSRIRVRSGLGGHLRASGGVLEVVSNWGARGYKSRALGWQVSRW